jgi:hypothetical protein
MGDCKSMEKNVPTLQMYSSYFLFISYWPQNQLLDFIVLGYTLLTVKKKKCQYSNPLNTLRILKQYLGSNRPSMEDWLKGFTKAQARENLPWDSGPSCGDQSSVDPAQHYL